MPIVKAICATILSATYVAMPHGLFVLAGCVNRLEQTSAGASRGVLLERHRSALRDARAVTEKTMDIGLSSEGPPRRQ